MKLKTLISEPSPEHPQRPYIIAEAGVNHEGSMKLARRLIHEAADGGAQAIKFQSYKAETLASKHSPAYWDLTKETTTSQYKLFKKYDSFWKNEFEELKSICDAAGIEFMSTPFDIESADFLNDLMDVYKISSSDLTNSPFIRYICSFQKPIVLSTGASELWEIQQAVSLIESHGNALCLLHCVLNYPTANENANLGMISDLQRRFPRCPVGYSDHTPPGDMEVLLTATLLGAVCLEKHFTFDKNLPGNDHYHAMDKEDLKHLNRRLDRVFTLLGDFHKHALNCETPARQHARRSLVAARKIGAGEVIDARALTWKRPGSGISPVHYTEVLGMRAAVDIDEDAILQWPMFK